MRAVKVNPIPKPARMSLLKKHLQRRSLSAVSEKTERDNLENVDVQSGQQHPTLSNDEDGFVEIKLKDEEV
jgi:hypothetical protein